MLLYERSYHSRNGEAIFDMALLKRRNVLIANITLTVAGMGMYLSMQALSYKFETVKPYGFNLSILDTGLSMVAFAGGMIVFSVVTGRLIGKVGIKPLAIVGAVITAFGFLLLAISPTYIGTLADEFVIGSGMSMMNASLINLLILSVEPSNMGLATSMNSTFRYLGSSIGAPVAGVILSLYSVPVTTPTGTLALPDSTAFFYAFTIGAACFAAAAVITVLARELLGKRKSDPRGIRNNTLAEAAHPTKN
jgi:MFS family permease